MSLFLTKTHESFHLNGSMEVLCRKPGKKKTQWLSFITSKHFLPWRKSRESLLLDVGVVNGNICAASVGPKKIITLGPPLSSTHATNYLWPCFRKFDVSLEDCRFKSTVQHVVWARYEELTQVTFGFKLWIVPNGQKVCKVIYWFLHNWSEVYHTMVDVLVKDLSSNSCYFPKKVKTKAKVVIVIVNFNIKIGLLVHERADSCLQLSSILFKSRVFKVVYNRLYSRIITKLLQNRSNSATKRTWHRRQICICDLCVIYDLLYWKQFAYILFFMLDLCKWLFLILVISVYFGRFLLTFVDDF